MIHVPFRMRDYIFVDASPSTAPTMARIKATVAEHYGITPLQLDSHCRGWAFARPRQVVMYLARNLTRLSSPVIGRHLGDRDHSTILHGIARIAKLQREDADLAQDVEALTERLSA